MTSGSSGRSARWSWGLSPVVHDRLSDRQGDLLQHLLRDGLSHRSTGTWI
jgi:hypothetical protein